MHRRDIEQTPQDEVQLIIIFYNIKNTLMHTILYAAKNINKNADIMQVQCRNHSCKGNIFNKLPNTKHTLGEISVK